MIEFAIIVFLIIPLIICWIIDMGTPKVNYKLSGKERLDYYREMAIEREEKRNATKTN